MQIPRPGRTPSRLRVALWTCLLASLQGCAYVPFVAGRADGVLEQTGVESHSPASSNASRPSSTRAPAGPRVTSLELAGHEALDADTLAPFLPFPMPSRARAVWSEPPLYDAVALDDAVDQLLNLYRRRGYFDAHIEPRLEWSEDRSQVRIRLEIREGAPVRVTDRGLEFAQGARASRLPLAALTEGLPLATGDIFEIGRYDASKQQILSRLREAGHLEARLEGGAEIDVVTRSAVVRWSLDPGPLVLLGPVQIEGLTRLDPKVIGKELEGRPGAPLAASWLEDAQRRLSELGWFRSVTVAAAREATPPLAEGLATATDIAATTESVSEAPPRVQLELQPTALPAVGDASEGPSAPLLSTAETWPVLIRVEERPPRSVRASVGYGTEDRARVELGWQHRHLLGSGRALRVRARHSSLLTGLEFDVRFPRFAGTRMLADLTLDGRQETLGAYDARRLEARLEFARSLQGGAHLRFGHRVSATRIDDVSPAAFAVLDDPEESSIQSATFAQLDLGRIDDATAPRHGQSMRLFSSLATQALGSDDSYIKSELDLRAFRPLAELGLSARGVVAGRVRVATTLPLGTTQAEDVPLPERLFAGGGDSVRGFEFQQLGPLDATNEPLGGTSLLVANLEWRVPLTERFGGVLFLDAGQVDLEPLNFRPSNLQYAVGAGLRISTPVGPLRLDLASLLNPHRDLDRFRIHFSVGHTF